MEDDKDTAVIADAPTPEADDGVAETAPVAEEAIAPAHVSPVRPVLMIVLASVVALVLLGGTFASGLVVGSHVGRGRSAIAAGKQFAKAPGRGQDDRAAKSGKGKRPNAGKTLRGLKRGVKPAKPPTSTPAPTVQ